MKFFVAGLVGVIFFLGPQLFASCKNNGQGMKHVKEQMIKGKKTKIYICQNKNKEAYDKKVALWFYDAKNNCKNCGCPSGAHRDETKALPSTNQKTPSKLEGLQQFKLPSVSRSGK